MEYKMVPAYGCYIFMDNSCTAGSNIRFALTSKSHKRQKKATVISYSEAVSYLLERYAMEDVIAETDAYMMHFGPP